MFFIHYQAYLIIPSILGFGLFIWQMYNLSQPGHDLDKSIDSAYNGLFGIVLAIWSSIFIESWKHKQSRLLHEWDMSSMESVLMNDERKGKFKFMWEYNSDTNSKSKI